jgi:hypothetical protein
LSSSSIYSYLKEKLKKYVDLLKKCPYSSEEMVILAFLHAGYRKRSMNSSENKEAKLFEKSSMLKMN